MAPIIIPSEAATEAPTEAPIAITTEAPTAAPIVTEAPIVITTEAPIVTDAIIASTTVVPPTEAPTEAPTTEAIAVTTQAPIVTEEPEGSAMEEESDDTANMVNVDVDMEGSGFGLPPIEVAEPVILEDEATVFVEYEEPESPVTETLCNDFIINCAEYNNSQYRICDVRPGDEFYAMYRPIQDSCRETCGFCDQNPACKALKEFCHETDVATTCPGTCAGLD